MSTTITNYTTYDLASYYTDVRHVPRLSDEEEQQLIATLARAAAQPESAQHLTWAKQRLIEGHLGLAISIARDLRSPRRPHLFPDLVQEANLALVQATQRCNFRSGGNYSAYIAAWMRGRVKQTLGDDWLLKPDDSKRAQVDALLAYLSPRAQTILRLRYGLLDDDERPRSEGEIARTLGLSRSMVHTTERDAMQRLQALKKDKLP